MGVGRRCATCRTGSEGSDGDRFSQGAPFALQLGAVGAVKAVAVVAGQDDFGFDAVLQRLAPPVAEMIDHLRSDRRGFESVVEASANALTRATEVLHDKCDRFHALIRALFDAQVLDGAIVTILLRKT